MIRKSMSLKYEPASEPVDRQAGQASTSTPRPESGVDCPICAILARPRSGMEAFEGDEPHSKVMSLIARQSRFRGGLVFKAHRLLYNSTLGTCRQAVLAHKEAIHNACFSASQLAANGGMLVIPLSVSDTPSYVVDTPASALDTLVGVVYTPGDVLGTPGVCFSAS